MKFVKLTEVNEKYPNNIDVYRGVVLSKTKTHITICGLSSGHDDVDVYTVSTHNHKLTTIKRDEFEHKFSNVMIKLSEEMNKALVELERCKKNLKFAELQKAKWFK